jgi:hypothetical protein
MGIVLVEVSQQLFRQVFLGLEFATVASGIGNGGECATPFRASTVARPEKACGGKYTAFLGACPPEDYPCYPSKLMSGQPDGNVNGVCGTCFGRGFGKRF